MLALVLVAAAVVWTAAVAAAPIAATRGGGRVAACAGVVYLVGSRVCHQRPERSFHLAGVQLPVCARCLGLYASSMAGAVVCLLVAAGRGPARAPLDPRLVLAVAALPTIATVALEWMHLAYPSNAVRALSAVPLGLAAGWIVVGSLWTEPASARAKV
jgi:uncharacterized membrane protein